MLTRQEMFHTAKELQENYQRLNYDKEKIARDTQIPMNEIDNILRMDSPNPSDVWKLRDYLEDMLLAEGKEVYPWSRLANHSANRWFHYDTPWRS